MIHIIDYGVGNLLSINNMLKRCGVESRIARDRDEISKAEKIILPGVGAFAYAMQELKKYDLIEVLNFKARTEKVPILGICLGAQLIFEASEEGDAAGLGWLKGEVIKFRAREMVGESKIPNMGWCDVRAGKPSRLLEEMHPNPRFYFVHSYHFSCENEDDVLLTANYGYDFVAGVESGNIMGVQFHPEKSHKFGMKLLSNFARNY